MEGKNKFNTYVVSFDYPSSYSSVFLRLRSLMYDMNFSSIVADEYGIPRQLNENSFAITTSLAASEIEDLIRDVYKRQVYRSQTARQLRHISGCGAAASRQFAA